jgi:TolA-binding protein
MASLLDRIMNIQENIMQSTLAMFVSLAVCAACALPAVAQAQTATQPMGASPRVEKVMERLQTRFASANTTHDGKLTRDQASAGMPNVARHFDEIDTQKQGYVTLTQIEAFMRQHAAQH